MDSILALSFYAAPYPPQSGGELRLYYIYYYLSKYYKINMITFVDPNFENEIDIIEHTKNFKEIRIPRSKFSFHFQAALTKYSAIKEWSAIIVSLESKFNKRFKDLVKQISNESNIIIFISPFLFTFEKELPNYMQIVYESYNLEYKLMQPFYKRSILGDFLLKYIFKIEQSLCKRSNLIFAVSKDDKLQISQFYDIDPKKISLSPNGINLKDYLLPKIAPKDIIKNITCLFIGSYHPPNFESVKKIISLANSKPDAYFLVAGGVSTFFIEYRSDMVMPSIPQNFPFFKKYYNDKISLGSGFYHIENWDSTPTRWAKPHFTINVGIEVDSIKLKLFSPAIQRLNIELGEQFSQFSLKEGWNEIEIADKYKHYHAIAFYCEKFVTDQSRTLGLAIQSLIYHKNELDYEANLTAFNPKLFIFKKAKNVILLGRISDEEKRELYHISDIALNPMVSGSGTNIKMLDYMAAGLPVITTPVGARGLGLKNYEHAIITDIPEFPSKMQELINDKELYIKLSHQGRKLVEENYDWERIADRMAISITDLKIQTASCDKPH